MLGSIQRLIMARQEMYSGVLVPPGTNTRRQPHEAFLPDWRRSARATLWPPQSQSQCQRALPRPSRWSKPRTTSRPKRIPVRSLIFASEIWSELWANAGFHVQAIDIATMVAEHGSAGVALHGVAVCSMFSL